MIEPIILIIFFLISLPLAIACYYDIKTRNVPIKTWWLAAFIGMPLSLIIFTSQIVTGNINIYEAPLGIIYAFIIIGLFYAIAAITPKFTNKIKLGGADFIAVSIILISSLAINTNFSLIYMQIFIIVTLISTFLVMIWNLKRKKTIFDYIMPLIIQISIAYYITFIIYLIYGSSVFTASLIF